MDWIKSYYNYYFKKTEVVILDDGSENKTTTETTCNKSIEDETSSFVILNDGASSKSDGGDDSGGIKIILSLDGGGMRGIVSVLLLQEIEKLLDIDIGTNCDIICGTSTGGILAYSKLYSVNNQDLLGLYSEFGKKIFPSSSMEIIHNVYNESTLFSTKELISTMETNFQDKIMSARKGFVVTVAQDKITLEKSVKIFANYENPSTGLHDDSLNTTNVDIIRSTAGIPGLFKLYENDKFTYFDGGFLYNCNLPIALIESSSLFPKATKLLFISLGTGYTKSESLKYQCFNSNISTDEKVEQYLKEIEIEKQRVGGDIKLKSKPPQLGGIFDLVKNLWTLYREYMAMPETYVVLQQFLKDHQQDSNIYTYRFDVELEFDISLHDSSLKAEKEMQRSVSDYVNNSNNNFNRSILNIKKLIQLNK